ncbi:MAG: hypothetical protein IPJ69_02685 [Deltaproteobacteria bacterium]|nr:MAG: hypothetical protein IPJ69_02685 [Deltaproteobacteria bacterium]
MSPLDIMASMAAYVVLPESTLLNTRSAWQNFVGESLSQNSGNTLVAANIGDAVFSIEHGENLAQQLGTDLITIEGGSHLPDENTASIIVKKVFEATRRTSGVIEITGSAHRRSA